MRPACALLGPTLFILLAAACGDDESASSTAGGDGGGGTAVTGTTTSSVTSGEGGGGGVGGAPGGGGEDGSGGQGGNPTTFAEPTVYAHLVEPFDTEEECLDAQDPEFFVNCYQVLEMCPDGTATFMLTDVLDSGTYTRGDGVIETAWEGASGAPPEVVFTVVSPTELVDDAYDLTWTLDEENVHTLNGCD